MLLWKGYEKNPSSNQSRILQNGNIYMRVCLCVIFFGNSYLQGASCLCEFCSWQWQTVVYSAFLCVYVCVCTCVCVCSPLAYRHTGTPGDSYTHPVGDASKRGIAVGSIALCFMCPLFFQPPPPPPSPPFFINGPDVAVAHGELITPKTTQSCCFHIQTFWEEALSCNM